MSDFRLTLGLLWARFKKAGSFNLSVFFALSVIWQGTFLPNALAQASYKAPSCCHSACSHCAPKAPCCKKSDNKTPQAPAALPPSFQNQFLALPATAPSLVVPQEFKDPLSKFSAKEFFVSSVPIFIRDCSYLL
jgi:hypothetical protein